MSPSKVKVGAKVLVPWGMGEPIPGEIVKVWEGPPLLVELYLPPAEGDELGESIVILADPSNLEAA